MIIRITREDSLKNEVNGMFNNSRMRKAFRRGKQLPNVDSKSNILREGCVVVGRA